MECRLRLGLEFAVLSLSFSSSLRISLDLVSVFLEFVEHRVLIIATLCRSSHELLILFSRRLVFGTI